MQGRDDELVRLLLAALAGDEKAYAAFLREAAALVRGFARRRASDGLVDAEDVVQDTLLAIHLKRHTWKTDAPVLPWIMAIARHKLIDAYRRRGGRIEVELEGILESLAQPDTEQPGTRDIERALDALTPGQRRVVSSISVEGRSISETAEALAISQTAVRVALHRGLQAIARRFGRS